MTRLDELYARAEEKNEARRVATVRRGPVSLIAVCLGVSLVVGITAAVDLRRLGTPRGTALAWTSAAVLGDCPTYFGDVVADQPDSDSRCLALRDATAVAREDDRLVELDVRSVEQSGDRATVRVRVQRPVDDGLRTGEVDLPLVRRDGDWKVERTPQVCALLPCP